MRIIIIGAGPAGCFAAINIKRRHNDADITILESNKPLAKLALTGGGRCNITNTFNNAEQPDKIYPRGHRLMKRLLKEFGPQDTIKWFEAEGIELYTQDDERIFPKSDDAMQVVNTLLFTLSALNINILTHHKVKHISKQDEGFSIQCEGIEQVLTADKIIVTCGGVNSVQGFDFLSDFRLKTEQPVPSLFSLCTPSSDITSLMGVSVSDVSLSIASTKFHSQGALLVTHWGISGPAVLKLSSYAARHLAERNYKAQLLVNWMGKAAQDETAELIQSYIKGQPNKTLSNVHPPHISNRLWQFFLSELQLDPQKQWKELGRKDTNRLVNILSNQCIEAEGKNKFKDEFVTCGGVALSNLNPQTLESKTTHGLYFAGEVLDIDAITGGFNLQAAWSTAYAVANAV